MDGAKRRQLNKAFWGVAKSCGSCKYGLFVGASAWGVCTYSKNDYIHGKYKRKHQLPAHLSAVCASYIPGSVAYALTAFLESKLTS